MSHKSHVQIEGEKRRAKELALPLEERVELIKARKERLENVKAQQGTRRPYGSCDKYGNHDGG